MSEPVLARAAARRPVDLRIAALLALLGLDRGAAELGAALGESGLLDAVEAIARLESHLAGCRQRVLAALDALAPDPPPADAGSPLAADADGWAALTRSNRASSVATRCGISPFVGSLALRRATMLAPGGSLGRVGAAMDSGELPAAKAELIADELAGADDALLVSDIVDAVLPIARTLGVGRLRDAIRAEIACAREAATAQAHDSAAALREVSRPQELGAGLADLHIMGPAPDIAHIWALVDQTARQTRPHAPDDSVGALRFDALVALLTSGATATTGSDDGRRAEPNRRPAINVVVGLGTLLGADDQPAELAGLGLIDARTARQLAADPSGTWRRLLVDDRGRLLSRSRAYRPPPTMADLVLARDRTCRFPGCRRTRLDVDHIIEHDRGGETQPTNLAALCRTHHNLKTHRLWDYRIVPESGDARWVDRHGHVATQPASRYRPPRHRAIARAVDRARTDRTMVTAVGARTRHTMVTAVGARTRRVSQARSLSWSAGADVGDDPPPF